MAASSVTLLNVLFLLAITLPQIPVGSTSNILIFPFALGINSRLFNMDKISGLLAQEGHNVTVFINSRTRFLLKAKNITVVEYNIPKGHKTIILTDPEFQELFEGQFIAYLARLRMIAYEFFFPYCRSMLESKQTLTMLKEQNFDLFLVDVVDDCGRILTDYLEIPTITYSNYGFNADTNIFYPAPSSFVACPDLGYIYKDRMTFLERVTNFITYSYMKLAWFDWMQAIAVDVLRHEYNISTSKRSLDSFKGTIMIIPHDFVLDYPRPIMPHVILIPGLFPMEPKPLEKKWLDILDNSGEHGVILLSFGSIAETFAIPEIWDSIAGAFSELPQTVIWKYEGSTPRNLGKNTHLVKWFPQNDILAHPNVKLFITHSGVSSTHEAVHHAVPVITIPLIHDQFRNAAYLVDRVKMGVRLHLSDLNKDLLKSKIIEVLNNEVYKQNALKTASLIRDTPIPPRKLFFYWIDYVIRHKWAKHLISEAAQELNGLQFHSIDVLAFLVLVVTVMITSALTILYCCLQVICKKIGFVPKHKKD